MRVLLIGHACCPGKGSEPGGTWNWAWQLSRWHEVQVIAYPEYREEVERYCGEHPNRNLSVVWIKPDGFDPWDPGRGERGIRLHYMLWLRKAYRAAKELNERSSFDLVHHLSLSTVSSGSPFWQLPTRFIWGPLGGGQRAPQAFRNYFGSGWTREALRSLRVRCAPYLPQVRRTALRTDMVLATNADTQQLLRDAGAKRTRLFLDSGVEEAFLRSPFPERQPNKEKELVLLWAGRCEARKALPIALQSLASLRSVPLRLRVAGDGPSTGEWKALVHELGLADRVEFLGRVPHQKMPELFLSSDAFVFTSLRDSFGSIVLEAMAHGLPVIALNHQGVGTFVPDETGVKVPVTTPAETVDAMAAGIRRIAENREALASMGRAAWKFAQANTWESRAVEMNRLYQEVTAADRHL